METFHISIFMVMKVIKIKGGGVYGREKYIEKH
jgi:hypothetical protein